MPQHCKERYTLRAYERMADESHFTITEYKEYSPDGEWAVVVHLEHSLMSADGAHTKDGKWNESEEGFHSEEASGSMG